MTTKNHGPAGMAGKICVSVGLPDMTDSVKAARAAEKHADVIEIRLDLISDPDPRPFMKKVRKPLLFTNRPAWEGGSFNGPEEERIRLLEKAIRLGAAYVDVEMKADKASRERILAAAADSSTRIIISWHNFKTTPSSQALASVFQEQYRSRAHIGKIVTMARDFRDVLRVLDLQDQAAEMNFPLIAFCMGRAGKISRLATLELNGFMTYAAPDGGMETAPGQIAASLLRRMAGAMIDEDEEYATKSAV